MNVQHEDDGKKGAFFIKDEAIRLAEMTYVWVGANKIIIDHTEVDDSLRGQGAGKSLVMEAVNFARAEKTKILPLCPYAKSVFDKTEEIRDVLS